jgi:hypothetical protein
VFALAAALVHGTSSALDFDSARIPAVMVGNSTRAGLPQLIPNWLFCRLGKPVWMLQAVALLAAALEAGSA